MTDKISYEIIDCPICSSIDHDEVYQKEYRLWNEGKMFLWVSHLVICKDCGMIFTNPQPTETIIEWFYASDIRFGKQSDYFRKSQISFLKENTTADCRTIFDIGAFNGTFLNMAREKGYIVSGIEPSEEAVNDARKLFDLKIVKGFFGGNFVKSFDSKFDIVTIRHVLEHVRDPITFLKLVIKITEPGKYIFIEVPDSTNPFAENIAEFFSNQHIMHYTENSLRNMANILGLKIMKTRKIGEISAQRVLFRRTDSKRNCDQSFINEYKDNRQIIDDYKKRRNSFMQKLKSKISRYNVNDVIVYGAGMHTSQLMQSDILENINIDSIVDSNPRKWGLDFEGYKVENPEILKSKQAVVLISSYDSQEEISNYLKNEYPAVEQIKLYDDVISYDNGPNKERSEDG